MDSDTLKSFATLAGGILGLTGGIFAFINGRLNEAKTTEDRGRVKASALLWLAGSLWVVSGVLVALPAAGIRLVAIIPVLAAYAIYMKLFSNEPAPVPSRVIAQFSAVSVMTAVSCALILSVYVTTQILEIEKGTMANISKLTDIVQQIIEVEKSRGPVK